MALLVVETIEVTPFVQNCRVLSVSGGPFAVVVDPGGDIELVCSYLKERRLTLKEVWLTHSHLDHCGGVKELFIKCGEVPLLAHPRERFLRESVEGVAKLYGISNGGFQNCPEPSRELVGGETLNFLGESFEVIFTPGHSPGHLCFYNKKEGILIAGDTLFKGSIGRTDLPGGDYSLLISTIKEKIFTLPETTRVLPGHGPDTTVGEEIKSNPFFNEI